jgi:hypothetical protein
MNSIRAGRVAALAVAVLAAALFGASPVSAASPTTPAGRVLKLPVPPATAATTPYVVPAATSDHCASVRAHLSDYAARGIKQVACETTTPAARTTSVTPNAFPVACGNDEWVVGRTEECILSGSHVWTTYDADTHAPTGTITYLISQDIHLSTTTSMITESVTFKYAGAVGPAVGLATVLRWTSNCSAPCALTSVPSLAFTVPYGGSVSFTVNYRDNPSAQTPDTFGTSYSYVALPPTFVLIGGPDTWSSPQPVRCDNNTPSFTNPGCVVPSYPVKLVLPLSKFGAAAANVQVGESKLANTPGLSTSTPLTRGNPALTDPNRGVTCGGFPYLPPGNIYGVVSDSCDEYPFASSQQSGGARKIPGSDCMEIVPRQDANGQWEAILLNPGAGTPPACLRGHVNSVLNSSLGSQAVGPLYTLNRMMIGDPYTVTVTQ